MTDRPLKVFITDPHLKGGGQVRYVTNLATQLVRAGHDVTLGCKAGSVLVEKAREAGCRAWDRFGFRSGLRLAVWRNDLREARRVLLEEKPDVVHVNGSQDHWVFAAANRLLGRPVRLVRTRHNTYPVSANPANRLLNRAWTDFQIVVCDSVRQTMSAQRTFDSSRLCTIHNGVDAELFRPDPEARGRARAEFGYSDAEVVVGIAARLVEAKGHQYLIPAMAQVRRQFPAARLLVLGQGDLDGVFAELAEEVGIKDITTFTGFREDMAQCVQAFDVVAQPSVDCDTSSFSTKEAMAAGKPAVVSDYGGLPEIVTDGREGFVVPAGTVDPLAEALCRLMADPALRAKMGQAGRDTVLRRFTVEVFAQKTVEAYRCALSLR